MSEREDQLLRELEAVRKERDIYKADSDEYKWLQENAPGFKDSARISRLEAVVRECVEIAVNSKYQNHTGDLTLILNMLAAALGEVG